MKSLDMLRLGEQGVVTCLQSNENIRRRLLDIGLIEGTKVRCLLKGPAGNPIAYLIRGAVIALRKEDLKDIIIAS